MKVSVFRGRSCFSEWLCSLDGNEIEYEVLGYDDIGVIPSTDTAGVVFPDTIDPRLRNSATQVLVNCVELGIPAYPDLRSHVLYNDKITQSYEFSRLGIPAPATRVFWAERDALQWLRDADFPLVCKTSGGAGSGGVSLLYSVREAGKLVRKAFSRGRRLDSYPPETSFPLLRSGLRWLVSESPLSSLPCSSNLACRHSTLRSSPSRERDVILFQEFLPDNMFDYRITVIGGRAFGMRRHNRENDFRASGSDMHDMNPKEIPAAVVDTAFRTAALLGMNRVMAADILLQGGEPKVVEVSYLFANPFKEYPGYWDSSLEWHPDPGTRFDSLTDLFSGEIRRFSRKDPSEE